MGLPNRAGHFVAVFNVVICRCKSRGGFSCFSALKAGRPASVHPPTLTYSVLTVVGVCVVLASVILLCLQSKHKGQPVVSYQQNYVFRRWCLIALCHRAPLSSKNYDKHINELHLLTQKKNLTFIFVDMPFVTSQCNSPRNKLHLNVAAHHLSV